MWELCGPRGTSVVIPPNENNADEIKKVMMKPYQMAGFPGAFGSVDVVHIKYRMFSSNLQFRQEKSITQLKHMK